MMPKFTRREFLKKSGLLATAGTLALSGCGGRGNEERLVPFLRTPEEQVAGTFTYFTSLCQMCPAGCGILVRTMNGRASKLEGNPQHPISQGRLCARGQAGLQALYNPDRLQGPEVRANQRTDSFEPTTWDEGLAILGQALSDSPGRIAIYGGHVPDHVYRVAARLMEAGGGSGRPTVWNLYRAAEGRNLLQQAAAEILGADRLPLFDLGAASAVISFNAGFLETWLSPVQYSRGFARLRTGANRGSLVAVEPRLSSTAAVADDWLSPPGGREAEVALIVGKLILDERLAAGDRPAAVDALFSQVEGRNLAEELGLDFENLVRIARRFARSEAPLAIPGGGLTAYDNAPAAIRAVLALNLLVGAPNRTLFLSPPPPAGGELDPREEVSSYAETAALLDQMRAGEVDVLLVTDGDPYHDLPEAMGFAEAAGQVPLIIDFSSFPTDTSEIFADVRLPQHTYLESWGFGVPEPGTALSTMTAQQPVVPPVFDTRSLVDIFLAGARLAGGRYAELLPWEDEFAYVRQSVETMQQALSADRIQTGSILTNDPEKFFLEWRQFGGWWSTQEDRPEAAPTVPSQVALEAPGTAGPGEARPYRLHIYPHLLLAEGRHANKAWLQETPDPMTTVVWQSWVEINPALAEELGLETGDIVRVASESAEVEVPVYVFQGIAPDVVGMPMGQGHVAYGRYANGRGVNTVDLLELAEIGDTGELVWGSTRVSIEKTGDHEKLARLERSDATELPTGI